MRLDNGGALLSIDGVPQSVSEEGEYAAVYRHFQQLIGDKASDLDLQPLRLVADSFSWAVGHPLNRSTTESLSGTGGANRVARPRIRQPDKRAEIGHKTALAFQ